MPLWADQLLPQLLMEQFDTLPIQCRHIEHTRDVFYVRREVDLMKTANLNAYIMHIFGKIELLSTYAN